MTFIDVIGPRVKPMAPFLGLGSGLYRRRETELNTSKLLSNVHTPSFCPLLTVAEM